MSIKANTVEVIQYQTKGVCCKVMKVEISDNKVRNVEFAGGCDGNLKGIRALLQNMDIDEIIERFTGITCGDKSTSCPDQLAQLLAQYKARN